MNYVTFSAVYPNPPRNLSVEKLQGNKVALKWLEPLNSLFTGYVIKYVGLRFVYLLYSYCLHFFSYSSDQIACFVSN